MYVFIHFSMTMTVILLLQIYSDLNPGWEYLVKKNPQAAIKCIVFNASSEVIHDFGIFQINTTDNVNKVFAKHTQTQSLWLIIKNIQETQRPVPGITELP